MPIQHRNANDTTNYQMIIQKNTKDTETNITNNFLASYLFILLLLSVGKFPTKGGGIVEVWISSRENISHFLMSIDPDLPPSCDSSNITFQETLILPFRFLFFSTQDKLQTSQLVKYETTFYQTHFHLFRKKGIAIVSVFEIISLVFHAGLLFFRGVSG